MFHAVPEFGHRGFQSFIFVPQSLHFACCSGTPTRCIGRQCRAHCSQLDQMISFHGLDDRPIGLVLTSRFQGGNALFEILDGRSSGHFFFVLGVGVAAGAVAGRLCGDAVDGAFVELTWVDASARLG
jgi:hypothetical protein